MSDYLVNVGDCLMKTALVFSGTFNMFLSLCVVPLRIIMMCDVFTDVLFNYFIIL